MKKVLFERKIGNVKKMIDLVMKIVIDVDEYEQLRRRRKPLELSRVYEKQTFRQKSAHTRLLFQKL